jgi:glycosyltransferase involved in cell wall biosynthesis
MTSSLTCTVVVPCYNEASRLDTGAFLEFLSQDRGISILFVNDASTDNTLTILQQLQSRCSEKIRVLNKLKNGGKGEAVRDGMLEAIRRGGSQAVGFWDADLATPLDAIPELLSELEKNDHLEMVLGSRVRLLGRDVHRKAIRHYLGRVFATVASILLSLHVYDTQCGAKLFRVTPQLEEILATPFCSRWVFDVEILARYIVANKDHRDHIDTTIYEYPLRKWEDVAGSKVHPLDFIVAFGDLLRIYQHYLA